MTTIDVTPAAGTDDGYVMVDSQTFRNTFTYLQVGRAKYGNQYNDIHQFIRFPVTIPVGATINVAYITYHIYSSGTPVTRIFAVDESNSPSAISSYSDYFARALTGAYADYTFVSGTQNTSDISAVIQELVDSYDFSAGGYIQIMHKSSQTAGVDNKVYPYSRDHGTSSNWPILHIEYTEAAADALAGVITASSALAGKLSRSFDLQAWSRPLLRSSASCLESELWPVQSPLYQA